MTSFSGKFKRLIAAVLSATMITAAAPFMVGTTQAQAAALPTPMTGIDVSAYQGNIDWKAVRAAGVTYAMVRVGNISYGLDNKFVQNVLGATAAGIRVGCYVYTYAKNATEAAQEAQFTVAALSQFPVTFPVALDLEDPSLEKLDKNTLADIANTFCNIIYEAGYTPVIYSYKSWLENKIPPVSYDHWVAHYAKATDYAYPYTMWQYSCTGRMAGVSGQVDMNLLYKDYFTSIIPEGTVKDGDITYVYHNWKRMNGMKYVNGVRYFYDVNGSRVTDKTWHDGDGDIIRVCKDGHVVEVTAAAQQYAAAQANALTAAQNAYQQAVAAAPAAAKAASDAQAALPALEQQAAADAAQVNTLAAAVTADISNVALTQQLAAAQAQAAKSSQALADGQKNAQNLQAAAQKAAQAVTTTQKTLTAQQQATVAAQAAVVIPD